MKDLSALVRAVTQLVRDVSEYIRTETAIRAELLHPKKTNLGRPT